MRINLLLFRQLLLFGIVGTIGFIVDAGVLYLSKSFLGLYWSRGLSFISAVFVTWLLNRNITFHTTTGNKISVTKEFLLYLWCMLFGGIANLATYYFLVRFYTIISEHPIIGVAIGSIVGMFINFISSKWLVFRQK